MAKHKGNELKEHIVKQVLKGTSIYSLAEQFEISKETIRRWVLRYQETGSVQRQNRDPVAYKVTEAHLKFAKQYIEKHPTVFLKDLVNLMRDRFDDFDITEQWLGKVLRANSITRKQVKRYHAPYYRYGKVVDRSELKSRFYDQVKEFPLNHIICMDETAVQLFMNRKYARCHIGDRCTITTTSNTVFKSYTLLVAINSIQVVGWKLYEEGGTNEERLIDFIHQFIDGAYNNNLIIMDNAPSHRKETVKKAIEDSGNKLLKSIPFFPRSNAVENFFSQLKHYMRDEKTKTFEELKETIHDVIKNKISPSSFANYFQFAYGKKPVIKPKSRPQIEITHQYKKA
jgi:transposase